MTTIEKKLEELRGSIIEFKFEKDEKNYVKSMRKLNKAFFNLERKEEAIFNLVDLTDKLGLNNIYELQVLMENRLAFNIALPILKGFLESNDICVYDQGISTEYLSLTELEFLINVCHKDDPKNIQEKYFRVKLNPLSDKLEWFHLPF